ncbi:MAG TPA: molybdopterin-dependent oxidoreductase [Pseudonocardiaceae bacterium]
MGRPNGRVTNALLLVALSLALLTGTGALAVGSAAGRWVVVSHGVLAVAVILLLPWKSTVVRRGLRRRRPNRGASVVLAVVTVATIVTGLAYSAGLVREVGGVLGMWLHVAGALTLVPLLGWHVLARGAWLRPADRSRRTVLRGAFVLGAAGLTYGAAEATTRLAGLPGARRRFTGSYEQGSFRPSAMPNTIWLNDSTPRVDRAAWRLTVVDGGGRRELDLATLTGHRTAPPATRPITRRATLDCTSGWFAHQDWTGVPLAELVTPRDGDRSVLIRSTTGYAVRLPLRDLRTALLATGVGGAELSPGHGFPARLVAPGRRGFWWVKWVSHIEVSRAPWWWQSPFPLA